MKPALELAEMIDGLCFRVDRLLNEMSGSASFPQGQSRIDILEQHFSRLSEKDIRAVLVLLEPEIIDPMTAPVLP